MANIITDVLNIEAQTINSIIVLMPSSDEHSIRPFGIIILWLIIAAILNNAANAHTKLLRLFLPNLGDFKLNPNPNTNIRYIDMSMAIIIITIFPVFIMFNDV